jgi:hypothetical protein
VVTAVAAAAVVTAVGASAAAAVKGAQFSREVAGSAGAGSAAMGWAQAGFARITANKAAFVADMAMAVMAATGVCSFEDRFATISRIHQAF